MNNHRLANINQHQTVCVKYLLKILMLMIVTDNFHRSSNQGLSLIGSLKNLRTIKRRGNSALKTVGDSEIDRFDRIR